MSAKRIFWYSTARHIFRLFVLFLLGISAFQFQLQAQSRMESRQVRKLKPDSALTGQSKENVKRDNSFSRLYSNGLGLLENDQPDSAIVYLQKASAIAKNHPGVMTNLARAYVDTKEFEKAQQLVEEAISRDSSDADAYRVKGRVMQSVGNHEQAVDAYQRSLELDSANPYAHNNLALIYIQQERFDNAISLLEKAVQLKDDVPFFYNNLGVAHEALGNYKQSKQAFQTALSLDSNYDKALINLKRVEQRLIQQKEKDTLAGKDQQSETSK